MFRTALTETLGIEYPIIQAGMGGVAGAELTAAVSNAGGLGVIGGAMLMADGLREEIRKVKDMTDKPFAVDLLLTEGMPGLAEQITRTIADAGINVSGFTGGRMANRCVMYIRFERADELEQAHELLEATLYP